MKKRKSTRKVNKKAVVRKRNRSQYTAFRQSFGKWWRKYRPKTAYAKIIKGVGMIRLYDENGTLADFGAPDYTGYMTYIFRNYL